MSGIEPHMLPDAKAWRAGDWRRSNPRGRALLRLKCSNFRTFDLGEWRYILRCPENLRFPTTRRHGTVARPGKNMRGQHREVGRQSRYAKTPAAPNYIVPKQSHRGATIGDKHALPGTGAIKLANLDRIAPAAGSSHRASPAGMR
jgi:hypothetical protein